MTIREYIAAIDENRLKPEDVFNLYYDNFKKNGKNNAFISEFYNEVEVTKENFLPFSIKDVFFNKGKICTAGSKMMSKFIAPYNSTVVERLKKARFNIVGHANCDEFCMGSTGTYSAFSQPISPFKNENGEVLCPGGSSSGSAISVSANFVISSLGTDTGGSVRTPASWNNLIGLKPTYGVLSRFGLVSFACSLDHPSIFAKNIDDCDYVFSSLVGKDPMDCTSVEYKKNTDHEKKKIGIIKEFFDKEEHTLVLKACEIYKEQGYEIEEISIPTINFSIETYYVLCSAEAASNLSRYSGIFYGSEQREFSNNDDIYKVVRNLDFQDEVKRRILCGNYVLYSANIEEYYDLARKIRQKIWEEFKLAFEKVDFFITPTTPKPITLDSALKNTDPITFYKIDLYTIFANLIGVPAINIPFGGNNHLPIGIQLIGKPFSEYKLFEYASALTEGTECF